MNKNKILVRHLGIQPYKPIFQAMCSFTKKRNEKTSDEIWFVEHFPVFTQGYAGRQEHILVKENIPIIKSNRGGQVTYHGPGQLIMYVLLNIKSRKIGIRTLITLLERTIINTLSEYNINSYSRADAPGVYVQKNKICSLGLRVTKGCSFHGIALNVNMDLSPFLFINPCGYPKMKMTQMCYWDKTITTNIVRPKVLKNFLKLLPL